MAKDTVKWFNDSKGFGFVTTDDGTDAFMHHGDIQGEGLKPLICRMKHHGSDPAPMKRALAIIVSVMVLSHCCVADEGIVEQCSFYASFDKTLDAEIAHGLGRPEKAPENASFRNGVRGQALVLGREESAVAYRAFRNVAPSGTVAFWLKAKFVSSGDRRTQYRPLLSVRDGGRGLLNLNASTGSKTAWNFFGVIDRLELLRPDVDVVMGNWHHWAVTWDSTQIKCFLDGELVMSVRNDPGRLFEFNKKSPGRVYIGPWSEGPSLRKPGHGRDDTLIDELMFFPKVLRPEQVLSVYNRDAEKKKISRTTGLVPPTMAVPLNLSIPRIDGVIEEEEWAHSIPIIKLIDTKEPVRSLAYPAGRIQISHDREHLYLLARIPFPEGIGSEVSKPGSASISKAGSSVEALSLYLSPDDGKTRFRFKANTKGEYTQSRNGDKQWPGPWAFKSLVKTTMESKKRWDVEMAIPFASLGVTAPKPGAQWLMNLSLLQKVRGKSIITSWTGQKKGDNWQNMGRLWFTDLSVGAAIVRQGDPGGGVFSQSITFVNPSQKEVDLTYKVCFEAVTEAGDKEIEESFRLEPGESRSLELNRRITDDISRRIRFLLRAAGTELPLFEQVIPYHLSGSLLTVTPLPGYDKVIIQSSVKRFLTAARRKATGGKLSPELRLVQPNGKVAARVTPEEGKAIELAISMDRPGNYDVLLLALDTVGKEVARDKSSFVVPKREPWMKAPAPMKDKVLPPFTPLEVRKTAAGTKVGCWGRVHTFGAGVLPTAIRTGGVDFLAGAIELAVDGKPLKGRSKLTKSTKTRAEFILSSPGPLAVKGEAWIEYDGFIWYALDLKAQQAVNQISLRIPVKADYAKLYHMTDEAMGSTAFDGFVRNKFFPYRPYVWIGDYERGLFWFAESRDGWHKPPGKPIRIESDGKRVWLEITFITNLPAGARRHVEFGLLATPVKPLPDNFPLNNLAGFHEGDTWADPPYKAYFGWTFGDQAAGWWHRGEKDFWVRYLRDDVKRHKKIGKKLVPYLNPSTLPDDDPMTPFFLKEWQRTPQGSFQYSLWLDRNKRGRSGHNFMVCPRSKWIDYATESMRNLLHTFDLDGFYFDFGDPRPCSNRLHGCSGEFPIRAYREFYRRAAALCLEYGKPEHVIIIHNSDAISLPAATFVTHFWNGEHWRTQSGPWMRGDNDYVDDHPFVIYSIQHSAWHWGVSTLFYPAIRTKGIHKTKRLPLSRSVMACTLPQGTLPACTHYDPVYYRKVCLALKQFGAVKATSDFIGYWKIDPYVRVKDKPATTKVSLWKNHDGKRALLVISNLEKKNTTVTLRLNPKMFGWARITQAENRLDDNHCGVSGLDGYNLKVNVGSHAVALIEITSNE